MAASALKTITTRAKQIYKKGGTWKGAIKKAGAEYRGGKKVGKVVRMKKRSAPKKRRRVSGTLSGQGSSAISGVRKRRVVRKKAAPRRRTVGSVSHHVAKAKKLILDRIEKAEGRKFVAKKKVMKRKIGKNIAALKSQFRKLC
jgi:hypothetical protein